VGHSAETDKEDRGKAETATRIAMTYYVRWIVYKHEVDTVETEIIDSSLDEIVKTCQQRLDEMRIRHADRPPNGFDVVSEDGDIVRHWVDPTKPV
jgi:hypothetical protein